MVNEKSSQKREVTCDEDATQDDFQDNVKMGLGDADALPSLADGPMSQPLEDAAPPREELETMEDQQSYKLWVDVPTLVPCPGCPNLGIFGDVSYLSVMSRLSLGILEIIFLYINYVAKIAT